MRKKLSMSNMNKSTKWTTYLWDEKWLLILYSGCYKRRTRRILHGTTHLSSTAFCRIQTMSYCSKHTQHWQKVVTTMLLLVYSLNFVPNKTFQYWRASSSRVAKCSFFLPHWYRNVYHAEMPIQIKTEFHLIMDDFKNLWTMPAILCRQSVSFYFRWS